MNVNTYNTTNYENIANWTLGENKPNSNPIKANFRKAKMNVNLTLTKDYRKKDDFAVRINKPNSNPISVKPKININVFIKKDYENETAFRPQKNKPNQTQFLVKDLIALVKNSCARLWALLQCFSENFDKPGELKTKGKFRSRLRIPHLLSIGSRLTGAGDPKNLLGIMPAKEGKIDLKHSFHGSAFCFCHRKSVKSVKSVVKGIIMIETDISRAIIEEYNKRLLEHLENDVVIVGAGPAGLAAGYYLAKAGVKTAILEKRLSIGGGIWGGAAGYNVIAVEDKDILDEFGITAKKQKSLYMPKGILYITDAIEFATALAYKAKKAGVEIFNLIEAEDIIVKKNAVEGVVVNNTAIKLGRLHVDPFCIRSKFLVDATGHPAELVAMLKERKPELFPNKIKDGFMDVDTSEAGVVEKTGEVYPGLYVTGMSVCAVFNLPRMGPIFGGMLKSGKKVAELIIDAISNEKIQSSNA